MWDMGCTYRLWPAYISQSMLDMGCSYHLCPAHIRLHMHMSLANYIHNMHISVYRCQSDLDASIVSCTLWLADIRCAYPHRVLLSLLRRVTSHATTFIKVQLTTWGCIFRTKKKQKSVNRLSCKTTYSPIFHHFLSKFLPHMVLRTNFITFSVRTILKVLLFVEICNLSLFFTCL